MTADEIADEVVDVLNTIASPTFAFVATNPPNGPDVERESAGTTVHVYPYSESETPQDRGDMVVADREVNVLLTRTLDANETRADCLAWLAELKDALRQTKFGGFVWRGNETLTLYDFDAWTQRRQFISLFRATYRGVV